MPIYRLHSPLLGQVHNSEQGAVDLKEINTCFLKSTSQDAFENAALCAIALSAASRGSEPRNLNFDDWQWDLHVQALETLWKESKTLKTYILMFCNDSTYMETDVLFLLGGFWALEDGLF